MKKLLLFLLLCTSAKAQTDSVLRARLIQDERIILEITSNLESCHLQFRTGVVLSGIGSAGILVTTLIDGEQNKKYLGYIGSSIFLIIGAGYIIDSHKFIGQASTITVTPYGLSLKYNF